MASQQEQSYNDVKSINTILVEMENVTDTTNETKWSQDTEKTR